MIFHFFKGNVFHLSPAIIESILANANKTSANGIHDHFFCIMNFSVKYQYEVQGNPYREVFDKYGVKNFIYINSQKDFLDYFRALKLESNRFIFHGTISPYRFQLVVYLYLLLLDRKILSRCNLICWGAGDFSFGSFRASVANILERFHQRIFTRMESLIVLSPEDLRLCQATYPQAQVKLISYFSSLNTAKVTRQDGRTNVIISHSGWPANKHIEIFELLKKYSHENISIVCPLCYGEPEYIRQVIEAGQRIFSDKFSFFTELKPREEYENLIKSQDIFISGAEIQTGLFALTTAVSGGLKVFISGNLLTSFQDLGYLVNDAKSLAGMSFEEFSGRLTDDEYRTNIAALNANHGNTEGLAMAWKAVYDHDLIGPGVL